MAMKDLEKALRHKGYRIPDGATIPVGLRPKDMTFVTGEVKYVDVERQTVTVDVFLGDSVIKDISICQPFAGTSSFISGMPEKGSIAIIGNSDNFSFILGYMPSYIFSCNQDEVKQWPDSVKSAENYKFYRHRKLRMGEVDLSSGKGSEVFLGDNVSIEGPSGESILIRDSDHSIVSTSISDFVFNAGVSISSGIAQRNALDQESEYAKRTVLPDGRVIYQLKEDDENALSSMFSEYRIEAEELSNSILPSNSVNSSTDLDVRYPVGIFSLGNFIGNNPTKDRTYGKLLGIRLFDNVGSVDGGFEFVELRGNEISKYGLAASLYVPDRANYEFGSFFGMDKEGHCYHFLRSATGGGLGTGRSMSILAQGSKKEIWGSDSARNNSWDMVLKGGMRWKIGMHHASSGEFYDLDDRSIHVITDGGAFWKYGTMTDSVRDFDESDMIVSNRSKYKKVEKVGGAERKEIKGTRETIIGGSDRFKITGMKTENISGSYNKFVGGDLNMQAQNSYSLKVAGEGQEGFASKNIICSRGSHELTIFSKGDIKETINVRGNKETRIGSGDIKETIVTRGNREFRTTSGDYNVKIGTQGNIKHETTAGSIRSKTRAGKAEIDATLQVKIKTRAAMDLRATKIKLKTATPASGVVTKLSHLDYVTGAPLKSSRTVKAST